jgi:hypothetical protein
MTGRSLDPLNSHYRETGVSEQSELGAFDNQYRKDARTALEASHHAELVEAAKRALNFIENTESEHDVELQTGDQLRAVLAKIGGDA